ncbi:protein NRT1/ PTR FAMILY 4.4-like [Abrus precatorius]|uniref:Protein NRT1/ PTR FAMILY 4.4-like n=1 Tax=Abrus precatorius TaxID=3816 RepID=A0A8B8K1V3_ABRPR|nr:protein NRT1/ PTR FAMILY 4.4-like [Abrus precatorius]
MALQENSSETNTLSTMKKYLKSAVASFRNLFVFSMSMPFIGGLIVSFTFAKYAVVSILMNYLTDIMGKDDLRLAAVVTILQDVLSSFFAVAVCLVSEAYTGCFSTITLCATASLMGIMLLWVDETSGSFSDSQYIVYVAIVLLALGGNGKTLSQNFLEYQLREKAKAKKESAQNTESNDVDDNILTKIWVFVPRIIGYITTTIFVYAYEGKMYVHNFQFGALLMGATYLFFYFGYPWYRHEEFGFESNAHKIYRVCRTALRRRKFTYPTSWDGYYWKTYKQPNLPDHNGKQLRLSPQIPRLFRWLDKAAIVKVGKSPHREEEKGELCVVKEVREVKSLVPLIYLGYFTFFAYSLLVAAGNTFFVAQTTYLRSSFKTDNDITVLFLIQSASLHFSQFICFLLRFSFPNLKKANRKAATITRIGTGLVFAVICCLTAWKVEVRRWSLIEEEEKKRALQDLETINMTTITLFPQFILWGVAEGLAQNGLTILFHEHVAESMRTFEESFIELGIVLNIIFLLFFLYYSLRYTYKEEYKEDEKIPTEDEEIPTKDEEIMTEGEEIPTEGRVNHAHHMDIAEVATEEIPTEDKEIPMRN